VSERETYFRKPTQRESKLAWQGMKLDFERIQKWHTSGQEAWKVSPGSLLHVVDTLTEPLQVSHLIGYLLHTAVDHLHALKTLLADAKAQHTFTPYSLIRATIEASSTVLWILQDDDPHQVARRTLIFERQSLWDQRRASKLVDPNADWDEDRLDILNRVLDRNHLTIQDVRTPPKTTELIETTATTFALPASRLAWQMCSAAAHGRPWAREFLTLFEAFDDDGVSKTISGQLVSNHLAMAISLNTACEVLDKARKVRNNYSRNPNHTGQSFTRPTDKLHFMTNMLIVPEH
jgi:hypothetical protein